MERAVKADSIELLDALSHEDFLAHLQGAGIFLHPAYYEPFGLSVLEAANSHCCLVLADIPSLRELWDGAAVFVDPSDCDKWVVEVNRLCRDPGLRERYGDAGKFTGCRLFRRENRGGVPDHLS